MRAPFLALTILAATFTSGAVAQQPAVTQFMSEKDIMALIDKAKAERKGDAPMVAEPILLLAPYKAQLEYRPLKAPAALHEKDAELFVVLQGAGDIIVGGKLVNEARQRRQPDRHRHRRRPDPSCGQGGHADRAQQHAAPGGPDRRRADRADDRARADAGAGELAVTEPRLRAAARDPDWGDADG